MVGNAQRKRKKGAVSAPDQSVEPVETTTNALQKQQSKILCAANVVCWLMADAGNLRAGSNTIPSQYTLLLVYMDTVFQRHPRVHHHRPALEKKSQTKRCRLLCKFPGRRRLLNQCKRRPFFLLSFFNLIVSYFRIFTCA